jgi:YggT family protein
MPRELGLMLVVFLQMLTWVIIARAILSWFVRDPDNPLVRFLGTLTDPLLKPFQKYLTIGMMDITPLVAILVLHGLRIAILNSIGGY